MSNNIVRKSSPVAKLAITALFTTLIIVGSFLKIPTPIIPITLQFTAVCITGLMLGQKWGTISVLCFILLGLFGVPVFTGGGGFSYIFTLTFGYIYGFALGVFFSGFVLRGAPPKTSFKRLMTAALINIVIVYICGALHFWLIKTLYLGESVSLKVLFVTTVGLFFVKDLVMAVLAVLLALRLRPVLYQNVDMA